MLTYVTVMKDPVEHPIKEFFPQLALDPRIINELNRQAGDKSEPLRQGMLSGSLSEIDAEQVLDFITDLIINEAVEVDRQLGLGAYDEQFPISVMRFGPIYWVEANEFDPIGYFKSQEHAEEVAGMEYSDFIGALKRPKTSVDD